jgi:hypothetical protein
MSGEHTTSRRVASAPSIDERARSDAVEHETRPRSSNQLSPRTSAAGAVLASGSTRATGSWAIKHKFGAGVLTGVGAVLTATGIGTVVGVPLMILGGTYFLLFQVATALGAGDAAAKEGKSVAKAVGKDLATGLLAFVGGAGLGAAATGFAILAPHSTLSAASAAELGALTLGAIAGVGAGMVADRLAEGDAEEGPDAPAPATP